MFVDPTGDLALICGIGVLAATLCGMAALWTTAGRFRWLWHVAPLGMLLAMLARLGGWEPLLLFGSQAAIVVGAILLARGVRYAFRARGRRQPTDTASASPPWSAWRFRLIDLGMAVLLAAVVLAIASPAIARGGPVVWIAPWRWSVTGLGLGAVTLGSTFFVMGPPRWYLRTLVLAASTAAGAALVLTGDPKEAFAPYSVYGIFHGVSWTPGWGIALACSLACGMSIYLCMLRAACWDWWTEDNSKAGNVEAPTGEVHDGARIVRCSARAAVAMLGAATFAILSAVYVAALPPTKFPAQSLPVPNGYDDFTRAGATINWNAVPDQDTEIASDQACAALARDNAAPLALLRQGLEKEICVPID